MKLKDFRKPQATGTTSYLVDRLMERADLDAEDPPATDRPKVHPKRLQVMAADAALVPQPSDDSDGSAARRPVGDATGSDEMSDPQADRTVANATLAVSRAIPYGSRVLRVKELIDRTGLARATLYTLMANDASFPRKVKLTARTVGFLESEVEGWILSRVQAHSAAA